MAAAPVPASLRMAANRVCHADCHEESCGNTLYDVACSSGTSARLFPGERDGRGLAQRGVPKGEVAAAQRGRSIVCRSEQISRVGIHHSWGVTVRAAGRCIALGGNHHRSGVALKVLATWAGAVNDSDPRANCYTGSKRRSSIPGKVGKKWRLSPLCRHAPDTVLLGLSPVSPVSPLLWPWPHDKIRSDTGTALRSITIASNF